MMDELTMKYINWYNYVRPHSYNDYLTPRNNKQTQMRKLQIPTRFHMGEVAALYDNPVKPAEYLYSLIESESK